MTTPAEHIENLLSRVRDGDIAALGRAITLVDGQSEPGNALYRAVRPLAGRSELIGITGPPGAGKSTLINALVSELRNQDKRVAVVAVDPSSPITGGAVLGDRTRMGKHSEDPGVYIRSLSSRGHLGGLSANVSRVVDLVDVAGWDVVLLETVGAGQSETEVAEVADINLVVNAPGLGDEVQAIKAGILEIADILVVNKADSPLAQGTERQLKAMLQLRREDEQDVPVICTVATEETGIAELLSAIQEKSKLKFRAGGNARVLQRTRRLLAQEAAEKVKTWLLSDQSEETSELVSAIAAGRCDHQQAIDELFKSRPMGKQN